MANAGPRTIVQNGIQYLYDSSRNKLLSITKAYLRAGTNRKTVTNEFLRLEDGQPSMLVGDGLVRKATLISLTANCEENASWEVHVMERGNTTPLTVLTITGASFEKVDNLDVDVEAGSVIQFKAVGTNIPSPRVMLELAWRL